MLLWGIRISFALASEPGRPLLAEAMQCKTTVETSTHSKKRGVIRKAK